MPIQTPEILIEAQKSLDRISEFDVSQLPRNAELGTELSFAAAVEPTRRVVDLFRKLPATALEEMPDNHLQTIRQQADQFFQLLDTIRTFSANSQANPTKARDQIVQQITEQYSSIFGVIFPYISFAVARTVDFNRLEEQGRAAVRSIEDRTATLVDGITAQQGQIQKTLEDIRAAAAEQGVSQQAQYFKVEADKHNDRAKEWLKWTLISAAGLVLYSIGSLFFHLIPGLDPTSTYDAVQLGASKLLVFLVIAYVVLTCGRNFMAHTHNGIVNRHRQNGLQTFTTLVDAASTPQAQDIVLSHAAASIFEPQETGFAKQQVQDGALTAASVVRSLAVPHSPS
jgi:hypothetical protein